MHSIPDGGQCKGMLHPVSQMATGVFVAASLPTTGDAKGKEWGYQNGNN
jgi:hypothetical protein